MAFWDLVYEVLNEVDNQNLHIYANAYPYEEDGSILVFDDTQSVEKINAMLGDKMRNLPELQSEIGDFRYDVDDPKWEFWINQAVGGDEFWTFSDEGFVCDECYKWHFYEQYNATVYANYKVYDGWIVCDECIRKDSEHMEQYVADMINNPKTANTVLTSEDLKNLGFEQVNDYPYANGFYGQADDPTSIMEREKEDGYEYEYLFSIHKNYNPFETEFDLWRREVEA